MCVKIMLYLGFDVLSHYIVLNTQAACMMFMYMYWYNSIDCALVLRELVPVSNSS